jgi:lipopolysaccharide/colanic/teichoic acid biosynthesis glycosyltransferase
VSAVCLVLTAPLMLLIALLVKLESPGPAIFRQERVGRRGRPFRVAKFRTMVVDAEDRLDSLRAESKSSKWLKLDHDPRVTRLGRILRLTSLDELLQFWNVLKGEMSLVGPRPLSTTDDAQVGGWARDRLDLAPGITGSWQVLGRTDIPFDGMVKLDYLYVTNWSLWRDVRIMLDTVPALLTSQGAN